MIDFARARRHDRGRFVSCDLCQARGAFVMRNQLPIVALVLLMSAAHAKAIEPEPTREQIKSAVKKSIALLQMSADLYTSKRECFSCHHQALPLIALTTAKKHGKAFALARV